jgi:2-oxoglutarate ferredoxin oxidoreductase subunit gamma
MTEKTLFTGFGGQGIISMGQVWSFCAMFEGKNVTFFPFYGAEKRGGIARANVIVSDNEIASPIISKADSIVVMNQDSLAVAEKNIKNGGLLLINSTLVKASAGNDMRIVKIPATEIAGKTGDERAANMVMLGALSVLTKTLSFDDAEACFTDFFPEEKRHLVSLNVKALVAGKTAANQ